MNILPGNKYRIEVRRQQVQIRVDGRPVVDVMDDKMNETIGGKTLDHGAWASCGPRMRSDGFAISR